MESTKKVVKSLTFIAIGVIICIIAAVAIAVFAIKVENFMSKNAIMEDHRTVCNSTNGVFLRGHNNQAICLEQTKVLYVWNL